MYSSFQSVTNVKKGLQGIIHGHQRKIGECRQQIKETEAELERLRQKQAILAPTRNGEV